MLLPIIRKLVAVPASRNIHIRTIQLGDGPTPKQSQRAIEVGTQNFDGATDAGFSGGGQAIGVGASAEHGAGAEAESLDDVGAAADASVHEAFGLPVDGLDDFRQGSQRRGNAIELAAAMIGDGNCRGAFVDRAARVFSSKDTFDDDGAALQFANPAEVAPGHGGFGEGGGDIHERHGAFAGDYDVGERGQTAIEQKACKPSRAREDLRKKRKFFEHAAADEFLHSVAVIALADSGDGGIDGDDERGKSGEAGAFNCGLGGGAATHQIELIEYGSSRGGFYVFQFVSRYGGENVGGARIAGSARGAHFAHGVHQAAVADGSEQEWESEIEAENAGAQVAIADGDRMARSEGDVLIDAAIFAECDLAFGAAIKVVEEAPGHAGWGGGAEICDADHAGRGDGAGGSSHSVMSVMGSS